MIGCPPSGCAPAADQIEITYLGVAGYLVRYRDAALLTAPFFTNPRENDVAPTARWFIFSRRGGVIYPDSALIERLLPPEADAASMILVGHSHYDHLMDVPYIARKRSRGAKIYGGPTMRHTLMGDSALRADSVRLIAITDRDVGDTTHPGSWFYDSSSTFRVMAIKSDHAPTIRVLGRGKLFAAGTLDQNLSSVPKRADDWKLGEPLTFLIDVLDRGRPRLRIYFESSASTPPRGFPPRAVLSERRVDVALLSASSSTNIEGGRTPEALLEYLSPSYVLVGHWESFFRPQTLPLLLGRTMDADQFLGALTRSLPVSSGWQMPLPRTKVRFNPR